MAGTTVGEVNVALEFDPSGATKGLKEFEKSATDAAKNTGDGFTVAKGVLANLATAGIMRAASAVVGLGRSAIDAGKKALWSYADYEQLVGGIETLFKGSADVVQQNAAKAYKTAGLSANKYMEMTTSFSATLLQGLGGNTQKAADIADIAIRDMSDNVNKLGNDMGMVQYAYQGFAKQNFTMLDNLKLGYGGTASEMARLINDSGVLGDSMTVTAETVRNVPFDKMIEAIHKVQTEMGITGTTAKEASETISGSVSSMKSAWDNLLVGIADDNADLIKLIGEFVDSAMTAAKNVVPRVGQIVDTVSEMVFGFKIFEPIAQSIKNIIESVNWAPIIDSIRRIAASVVSLIPILVDALAPILSSIFNLLGTVLPIVADMLEAAVPIIGAIVSALSPILAVVIDIASAIITLLKPAIDLVVWAFKTAMQPILTAASQIYAQFIAPAISYFNQFKDNAKAAVDIIAGSIGALPSRVLSFIDQVRAFFVDKFNSAKNAAKSAVDSIVSFVTGIPGRVGGKINEIKTKFTDAINGAKDTIKSAVDAIVEFITGIPGRIGDIGGKIADKITSGVSGAVSSAQDAIGGVLNAIGLASGGYVKATPGGTLAVIGEGGEDEFVIPRSQMIDLLTGVSTAPIDDELPVDEVRTGGGVIVNNHFTINSEMDAEDIGRRINNSIRRATI